MCGILQKMKNALKIVGRGHLHFGIKRSNKSWICKRELSFTKEGAISKIKYLPTKLQFLRLNFYQTLWNYTKAEWPINSGSLFFYLFISQIILFDSSDSKSKHYPYQGTCYFLPENMWVPPITCSALQICLRVSIQQPNKELSRSTHSCSLHKRMYYLHTACTSVHIL